MSRPWRIEYEGALYHLLSRGNGRSDIFIDDKDGHRFLEAVGEMSNTLCTPKGFAEPQKK